MDMAGASASTRAPPVGHCTAGWGAEEARSSRRLARSERTRHAAAKVAFLRRSFRHLGEAAETREAAEESFFGGLLVTPPGIEPGFLG
jgi:hypothetical protein